MLGPDVAAIAREIGLVEDTDSDVRPEDGLQPGENGAPVVVYIDGGDEG